MNNAEVKIAKPEGKALESDSKDLALDSNLSIPKIFKSIRKTTNSTIVHGFNYPIKYLAMREITVTPKKYAYALPEYSGFTIQAYPNIGVDDTNLYLEPFPAFTSGTPYPASIPADAGVWGLMMVGPLKTPITDMPPLEHIGPVIKIGDNTETDPDYKLRLHTGYDSLKVAKTGTLTLNLPAWNAPVAQVKTDPSTGLDYTEAAEKTDTTNEVHGLDYVPYYQPFVPYRSDLTEIYKVPIDNIPASFSINELQTVFSPSYAWPSPQYTEWVYVWISDSRIYIDYVRRNWDSANTHSFPTRTVTMGYTIFHNRVDEEFNLLT